MSGSREVLRILLVGGTILSANPSNARERDPETGLVIAAGFESVRLRCTGCHSAKLVAQNRATREGWIEIIRWMQRTQKLGSLGEDEPVIIDYLAMHYGPGAHSRVRRRNLIDTWSPQPAARPPSPHRNPEPGSDQNSDQK